jgi:hypothetical protein
MTINIYAQKLHTIRFIHGGEELKPVGTLVISVEKKIQPNDKPLDYMYGQCIKTDIKTFDSIRDIVKEKTYITSNPKSLHGSNYYKIVDSDGSEYFLDDKNFRDFFEDLRNSLKDKDRDIKVIEAFKNY